jgi:cation diffusion facilitator CzcD-associated flavoprotein CzcO
MRFFQKTNEIRIPANPKTVIIGSGIGGLCMAQKLKAAGVENFRIFEKANSLGGTWRDNRYPGVGCDIPSTIYTFSFFLNPEWSGTSAPGSEILSYLESLAHQFDLHRHIEFGRNVIRCRYIDGQWHIDTSDGRTDVADVVIAATGFLHVPNIPHFEGIQEFEGKVVHSSHWDPEINVSGRAVANIGMGSSSVQIIPAIVDQVSRLVVYQRTAQWMLPFPQLTYSQEERRERRKKPEIMLESYQTGVAQFHATFGHAVLRDETQIKPIRDACEQHLSTINDVELRRKLTPDYEVLCKRIVFSTEIYKALQRPNCELVADPIKCFRRAGIETHDGRIRELDVVILSTGFDPHLYCRPIGLVGEQGITLERAWAHGTTAFESVALHGFPNFFMVGGPFSPIGNSAFTVVAELEASYIIHLLKMRADNAAHAIMPRSEAQRAFVADMLNAGKNTVWESGCRTWYLDNRGNVDIWTRAPEEFVAMFSKGPKPEDFHLIS